jgi:hypothetical protein
MESFKVINHQVNMRGSIAAPDEAFHTPVRRNANDGYSNESRNESRQDRRAKSDSRGNRR